MSDSDKNKKRYESKRKFSTFRYYFFVYGIGSFCLVLLVYDIYREIQGIPTNGRIKSTLMGLIAIGAGVILSKGIGRFFKWMRQREEKKVFVPGVSGFYQDKKPDLEFVLHDMKTHTAGIVWKTIGYCIIGFDLLLLVVSAFAGHLPNMSAVGVIAAVGLSVLAMEKYILRRCWMNRPMVEILLNNTEVFIDIPEEDEIPFLKLLKRDLENGLLYYSKELVLTENYIFCKSCGVQGGYIQGIVNDLMVIPRNMIEELSFQYIHYHQTMYSSQAGVSHVPQMQGHFQCKLSNGRTVSFYLGSDMNTDLRCAKVMQVFSYYGLACVTKKSEYQ